MELSITEPLLSPRFLIKQLVIVIAHHSLLTHICHSKLSSYINQHKYGFFTNNKHILIKVIMFNMLSSVEMSIVYNCFIISHDLTRTVSFMYLNVCKATLTKA